MRSLSAMKRPSSRLGIDPRVVGKGQSELTASLEPRLADDPAKLGHERAER